MQETEMTCGENDSLRMKCRCRHLLELSVKKDIVFCEVCLVNSLNLNYRGFKDQLNIYKVGS